MALQPRRVCKDEEPPVCYMILSDSKENDLEECAHDGTWGERRIRRHIPIFTGPFLLLS
jgi:hypothetical protein